MHSKKGFAIWAASNNFDGRYACLSLSTGPCAPFFECWAVVDDFGNLVTI